MKKVFVADDNFSKVFSRSLAKGHKDLVISEDVDVFNSIEIVTEGTSLKINKVEDDSKGEFYTVLCKEFGLVGMEKGFKSIVSVIFLNEGNMLVTLRKGAIVLSLDGKLLMPAVEVDSAPAVAPDDVLWVNADYIMGFKKYWGIKGQFIWDFELVLELSGSKNNGLHNFHIRQLDTESVDISLGYVAQYEQNLQLKEDAKAAKKFAQQFINPSSSTSSYEFDDDDEYEDDEDEYDDYEDDDDDDLYGY